MCDIGFKVVSERLDEIAFKGIAAIASVGGISLLRAGWRRDRLGE